jgi:hypothetical protein
MFLAETAALAGAGAGGAAAGAAAERDRLVRGRPGAGPGAVPGGAPASEGKAPPGRGATPPGAPLGAPPDDEARSVRNAERFGAKVGKPGAPPLMQPATGSTPGEEDAEHVRKYGIDSGDVFEDGRLIAPALIGDDDDPRDEQKLAE